MIVDTLPQETRGPAVPPPTGRLMTSGQAARIRRVQRAGAYLILVLSAAAFILPLVWMLSTALKSRTGVLEFPPRFVPNEFHWENFPDAWTSMPFTRFLLNSVFVTALSVAGTLVSCILPAYAFARLRARMRGPMCAAMRATMMIPAQVALVPKFLL